MTIVNLCYHTLRPGLMYPKEDFAVVLAILYFAQWQSTWYICN